MEELAHVIQMAFILKYSEKTCIIDKNIKRIKSLKGTKEIFNEQEMWTNG